MEIDVNLSVKRVKVINYNSGQFHFEHFMIKQLFYMFMDFAYQTYKGLSEISSFHLKFCVYLKLQRCLFINLKLF